MTEFKRLLSGNIILDGIMWGPNPDKAIKVKDKETGNRLLNIRLEENFYYPMSIDKEWSDKYSIIYDQPNPYAFLG